MYIFCINEKKSSIGFHYKKKPSTKNHKYPEMDSCIVSVVLWVFAIFLHTTKYFRGKMVKGIGGWAGLKTKTLVFHTIVKVLRCHIQYIMLLT